MCINPNGASFDEYRKRNRGGSTTFNERYLIGTMIKIREIP